MTIANNKIITHKKELEFFLPDTRGVTISPFGKGNFKLGPGVITYSKLAEHTCPGATPWCLSACYAKRIDGPVRDIYITNTAAGANVPDLPEGTTLVRLHVSGDFDSIPYIKRWIEIVTKNPNVKFWAYTRSWRVENLLPTLNELFKLPNIQLFASVDDSVIESPPIGWRIAWIEGNPLAKDLVCPEEKGRVANCEQCGYCFNQPKKLKDVIFIKH